MYGKPVLLGALGIALTLSSPARVLAQPSGDGVQHVPASCVGTVGPGATQDGGVIPVPGCVGGTIGPGVPPGAGAPCDVCRIAPAAQRTDETVLAVSDDGSVVLTQQAGAYLIDQAAFTYSGIPYAGRDLVALLVAPGYRVTVSRPAQGGDALIIIFHVPPGPGFGPSNIPLAPNDDRVVALAAQAAEQTGTETVLAVSDDGSLVLTQEGGAYLIGQQAALVYQGVPYAPRDLVALLLAPGYLATAFRSAQGGDAFYLTFHVPPAPDFGTFVSSLAPDDDRVAALEAQAAE